MTNKAQTDQLIEIGKEAQIKENEIVNSEKEVAEEIREVVKSIFGGKTRFRMGKQHLINDTDHYDWVFSDIIVILENNIEWRSGDFGDFIVRTVNMRVTTTGNIIVIEQHIDSCRQYDLSEGTIYMTNAYDSPQPRSASDQEIVKYILELVSLILDALGKRIDKQKEEKEKLKLIDTALKTKEVDKADSFQG